MTAFHQAGVVYPLPRNGSERRFGPLPSRDRCHDCGVEPGGLHHPGCDVAKCPVCGDQLLSCGCRFDEDGDATDDW